MKFNVEKAKEWADRKCVTCILSGYGSALIAMPLGLWLNVKGKPLSYGFFMLFGIALVSFTVLCILELLKQFLSHLEDGEGEERKT